MKRILISFVMYLPVILCLVMAAVFATIATVGIIRDSRRRQSNQEEIL